MLQSPRDSWNREYQHRGIPSSYRSKPSTVLKWALSNWSLLADHRIPATALDSGCGTGRNSRYMTEQGVSVVVGLDISDVAIKECSRQRLVQQQHPSFLLCDLTKGLPLRAAYFDFVCDVFVYKHVVDSCLRAMYREEIARVLKPGGHLLLSLAESQDGYYAACPTALDADTSAQGPNRMILDPVVGVESVLFSLDALVAEMSELFVLEMSWQREQPGQMHGREYLRRTMATIWRLRQLR